MPSLEHIANLIHEWLNSTFSSFWATLFEFVIVGVCIIGLFAVLGLVLIMMERKVSAWMQCASVPTALVPPACFKQWPTPLS